MQTSLTEIQTLEPDPKRQRVLERDVQTAKTSGGGNCTYGAYSLPSPVPKNYNTYSLGAVAQLKQKVWRNWRWSNIGGLVELVKGLEMKTG